MELDRLGDRRPTVRQIYAIAEALCERQGEELPGTAEAASELIERLRVERPFSRGAASGAGAEG